jgi:FixJ family two-component response regulator
MCPGHPVATTANVLRVDLLRMRAERARVQRALAFYPPRSLLAPATPLPAGLDLAQPQVSILESDHTVAQSMARILQAEGFAARIWASAREFIGQPEPVVAGCLIANANMPGMTGLELQREVNERQWPLPVIFLTSANDITTAVRGMKAGAINCLPKPVQRAELLEAVREALSESRAVRAQRAGQLRVRQMLARLTPREHEVLDLALAGLLVKQIAARLGTAEKTVKTHKGRLMRKMQVRSTLALVQLMHAAGLPPLPPVRYPAARNPWAIPIATAHLRGWPERGGTGRVDSCARAKPRPTG